MGGILPPNIVSPYAPTIAENEMIDGKNTLGEILLVGFLYGAIALATIIALKILYG